MSSKRARMAMAAVAVALAAGAAWYLLSGDGERAEVLTASGTVEATEAHLGFQAAGSASLTRVFILISPAVLRRRVLLDLVTGRTVPSNQGLLTTVITVRGSGDEPVTTFRTFTLRCAIDRITPRTGVKPV